MKRVVARLFVLGALASMSVVACGARSSIDLESGTGGATTSSGTSTPTSTSSGAICAPGEVVTCPYGGPPGTEGVGLCRAGEAQCRADGAGFLACEGEVLPEEESCFDGIDRNCDGHLLECPQALDWVIWPDSGDYVLVRGVATMPNGDVVIVGIYSGYLSIGGLVVPSPADPPADQDAFILRVTPSGAVADLRTFGTDGSLYVGGVSVDAQGNLLLTGAFSGTGFYRGFGFFAPSSLDAYVLMLDESLSLVYARVLSGPNVDYAWTGTVVDGNAYVGGQFEYSIDLGFGPIVEPPGDTDMFLVGLNLDGTTAWAHTFGEEKPQSIDTIDMLENGTLVAVGTAVGFVNFGGGVFGSNATTARMPFGLFSPDGVYVNHGLFDGSEAVVPRRVTRGSGGHFSLSGRANGTVIAPIGEVLCDTGTLAQGSSFVVYGDAFGFSAVHCGGDVLDSAPTALGKTRIVGGFGATLPLGGFTLEPNGGPDFFLATLAPEGGYTFATSFGDGGFNAVDARLVPIGEDSVVVAFDYTGAFDIFGTQLPDSQPQGFSLAIAKLTLP